MISCIVKKTIVYQYPTKEPIGLKQQPNFLIKEITLDTLQTAISQVRNLSDFKLQQFVNRMNQKGDRCFGFFNEKGICVHYSWVRIKGVMHIHEVNYKFNLEKENAFWIFDCRTHESARGKGLYPEMINYLANEFPQDNGIHGTPFIDVVSDNTPSIRGIEKAGFIKKYVLVKLPFLTLKRKV